MLFMAIPMLLSGQVLWPSWSGHVTKSEVPCPKCKSGTTLNLAGGLAPGSYFAYYCEVCGAHLKIGGIPSTITILKEESNVNYRGVEQSGSSLGS
jgi:hypothetical protein